MKRFFLALSLATLLGAAASPQGSCPAYLHDDLGDYHHQITTSVPLAQRYFDQGLILAYGFGHGEAARDFREAIRLDPGCAMCNWGLAYVLGPNINTPMVDANVPEAYAAAQRAVQLAKTPRELAYARAMAARYVAEPVADRSQLDLAYADAMRTVAAAYPDDHDAQTLFAEAAMDTMPWNYWLPNGQPKPLTTELLKALQSVLAAEPLHAGANHFWIHAVEAVHPEWAVASADRLQTLVPGSSHLLHMSGHIYFRIGRYHDAEIANDRAIAVDKQSAAHCHVSGADYSHELSLHNYQFLLQSVEWQGERARSLEVAQELKGLVNDHDLHMDMPLMNRGVSQDFWSSPYLAQVRFGQWSDVLAQPQPAADLLYPLGLWHFARSLAFIRQGHLDEAAAEVAALDSLAHDQRLVGVHRGQNDALHVLGIADADARGELAAAQGDFPRALAELELAVQREDALSYEEPPSWPLPTRLTLGAVQLAAGQPTAAEATYVRELQQYPEDGWGLFGLYQSLTAQGKTVEAAAAKASFDKAWAQADVTPTASRF